MSKPKFDKITKQLGEVDYSGMKMFCVSCGMELNESRERYINDGNYCRRCTASSDLNRNYFKKHYNKKC